MIFEHSSYRDYLKAVLAQRIGQNAAYSLRAFARQLEVHHTTLVQVFATRRNLSRARANHIATRLGLKESEIEYFLLLIDQEEAEHPEHQARIRERLAALGGRDPAYNLSIDHFRMIADWYHVPILQLARMPSFAFDQKTIAKKLGISVIEAEQAIQRLERLELIERTKTGYRPVQSRILAQAKAPSDAINRFHHQMLSKASEALGSQPNDERLMSTETFAFDSTAFEEVRRLTNEYLDRVVSLAQKGKKRDQVYHLGTYFFSLTPERKRK